MINEQQFQRVKYNQQQYSYYTFTLILEQITKTKDKFSNDI